MTRWAVATLAALLVGGAILVWVARVLGKSGSRASVLVSVVAHWLAAYSIWNFAGGLALHYGYLSAYHGGLFAALALAGGVWHYRAAVTDGPDRGRLGGGRDRGSCAPCACARRRGDPRGRAGVPARRLGR